MRLASIGKWVAMCGIVVLVLSIAPMGAGIDPHDTWWGTRWKWMQGALRPEHAATPVTVNPFLLYLGMLLSVGGMALAWRRDRGASTALAATHRTSKEKRSGQIFVGNIAFSVTEQDLRALFTPYGVVDRINLITDRETGRPRGFGFVEMADDQAAQAAIAGLNGTEMAGRALNVNEARQREERRPPSGGPRGGGGGRRW